MRNLLEQKTLAMDRPVLLLLVFFNAAVLLKLQLQVDTLMGLVNGSLAAALLVASLWRPTAYANSRLLPIVLMRLLVCALPLINDTVGHFGRSPLLPDSLSGVAWQLGHAAFMLLVGISWAVGMFVATFLLLPPVQHLLVHAASLAMLLHNNQSVCQHFLQQDPSHAAVIEAADAGLRALIVSVAPAAQQQMEALGSQATRQASCVASAAAMQVSLGVVLPTMLAWHLQSRMAASIAAHAEARQDSRMAALIRRSPHATLCSLVAQATQGCATKLLLTGASMLLTYIACLRALT